MRWIGLTGGIASGKSTVSGLFKGRGIPVVDADEIAHNVVKKGSPGLDKVKQAFGLEIINSEGHLDRQKLGQIVFGNPVKLSQLEAIIHPLVQAEVRRLRDHFEALGSEMAIYDVPLLFEKNLQAQFDGILLVGCDAKTQLDRILKRNGLSEAEALKRIAAQIPLEQKRKLATWYLDNSGSLEDLNKNFAKILTKIQSEKV